MTTLKELKSRTNIHDYLDRIGAKPPLIDVEVVNEAKKHIIWCNSIEDAVEIIVNMDEEIKLLEDAL